MSAQSKERESYTKLTHVLGEFDSPGALVAASRKVREAGYTKFDCHSPFPVHGIDPAMGIKRTILPWIVFGAGAFGLCFALFFQYYLDSVVVPVAGRFSGWHWVISGKPFWSSPANIPIAFEFTVLLSAFATFFSMWGLNKLPQVWHPLFQSERFARVTTDSFFISIDSDDPEFDEAGTQDFLSGIGATAVEPVHIVTGRAHRKLPKMVVGTIIVTTALAVVPFAFLAKARAEKSSKPHYHVIPNMDFQPSVGAQDAFAPFADDRGTQGYVPGTVAWGRDSAKPPSADDLAADDVYYRGIDGDQWATRFPKQLQLDMDFMKRGQNRFNIYCRPCHGASGDGAGVVHHRAEAVGAPATGWNQPTDLRSEGIARLPHGQLFNTITHGVRTMPSYAAQIPVRDRWAIIFYLRALQRAECGQLSSIPEEMRSRIKGGKATVPAPAGDAAGAGSDAAGAGSDSGAGAGSAGAPAPAAPAEGAAGGSGAGTGTGQ